MNSDRWRQVEELYRAARDPHKRASVLSAVDPELRREVEALLAQDEGGSTQTMFGAGAQLGPYKIDAPIGAGKRGPHLGDLRLATLVDARSIAGWRMGGVLLPCAARGPSLRFAPGRHGSASGNQRHGGRSRASLVAGWQVDCVLLESQL